eukprot:SAG11_NODE_18509_length_489_cov_0.612821_1_plen_20_part_10
MDQYCMLPDQPLKSRPLNSE